MVIQEAAEMYLETILRLINTGTNVRSIDLAREMGYSKPTISEQMKKFRLNGYININSEGHISLTDKGMEIAEKTLEKHNALIKILKKMNVSDENAVIDACRIEHYISEETFECMKKYFDVQ